MDETDRHLAELRKCRNCGGDDRYFFGPVVDWNMQLEYIVCDSCMTRENYMIGTKLGHDPTEPLEGWDSPANADALDRLSRYTDITEELRSGYPDAYV